MTKRSVSQNIENSIRILGVRFGPQFLPETSPKEFLPQSLVSHGRPMDYLLLECAERLALPSLIWPELTSSRDPFSRFRGSVEEDPESNGKGRGHLRWVEARWRKSEGCQEAKKCSRKGNIKCTEMSDFEYFEFLQHFLVHLAPPW